MAIFVSETDIVGREQEQADILEERPHLNFLLCIMIVVCLSSALWLGIYTAVVALL